LTDTVSNKGASPGLAILLPALLIQQTMGAVAFPISKFGLEMIEPFTFAFFRFVIASAALLLLVSLRKRSTPIEKRDYIKILGLGILIIPLNQTLYLYGQKLTGAGHGSLLFATVPLWVFLAAVLHLRERLIPRRVIGVVVGLIGVGIIMSTGAIEIGMEYLIGDLFILVAVIAWAYYTILGKPLVEKYGAIRVTAYALISGSVLYFPFGLFQAIQFDYSGATAGAWWAVIYMALGTSVIVYVVWYWVLKYMEVSRIAVFHNIQPVIATVVAYFWLGEPLGWSFFIGGLIALGGVVIAEV